MFSFTRRKRILELQPYMRRLCDLTAPNVRANEEERVENRYNRTIPTLLCPWTAAGPVLEQCEVVLTRDLSDRGIGLVTSAPLDDPRIVVAFWLSREQMEPWFFLGEVQHSQPLGSGLWSLGVRLTEYANDEYREQLRELQTRAASLLPPAPQFTA
jgi:hypothetical protein